MQMVLTPNSTSISSKCRPGARKPAAVLVEKENGVGLVDDAELGGSVHGITHAGKIVQICFD